MKIEDLKVGDELVCVDREGFDASAGRSEHITNFIISRIGDEELIINDGAWCIYSRELKYFKKKEQYTFNDLIDVAVQAFKDKVLYNLNVRGNYIEFNITQGYTAYFDDTYIEGGIEEIQALYKETFVIESEEDIERIEENATVTLANGEVVYFAD